MNFHFRLMPVDDIPPWRTGEGHPTLSWFGLTLGYFWIEVGGQELFRYTGEVLDHWQRLYPESGTPSLPYEDHQVARYWEDLLDMLPAILDPLPVDFAARMNDPVGWKVWQDAAYDWQAGGDGIESAWDTYYTAVAWQGHRIWDAGHLAYPPRIWLWRVENNVHIRWDNRDIALEGITVWEAQQGEHTLPVAEFLCAVESFNDRFIFEMSQRVNAVERTWPCSDVEIDMPALVRDQAYRMGLLKPAVDPWVAQVRRAFPWETVRAAIKEIQQYVTSNDAPSLREETS